MSSKSGRITAWQATAAGLVGAIAMLGWAPFGWWPLPLLGYAVLFRLVLNTRTAFQAALLGLAFGLGLHSTGHGWVLDALHRKSEMALIPATASALAFVCYLAMFSSLPCLIWRMAAKAPIPNPTLVTVWSTIAFASLATLSEWSRSIFFNGFTSLSLGYSLTDTWLAGYAPVAGVYGVGWLGYLSSTSLVLLLWRRRVVPALVLVAIAGGGIALDRFDWVQAAGEPLSYRLIQSNVAQQRKFNPLYAQTQMQRLVEVLQSEPADLIVTPETALTVFFTELPSGMISQLQRFSQRSGSHMFLGSATLAANAEGHNSVVHIAPGATRLEQYDKVRLMPFGEYSPTGFGWFGAMLNIPLKDLRAGPPQQQPFLVGTQGIGTLICHEDLIGEESRRWLPSATLLINPSNLAWFEGSLAIPQRLQIARMRALESGRPILRATNTGVTAMINHRGIVSKQLPEMQEGTLNGQVQPMQGLTPYARFGDWPVVFGSALYALLFYLASRRHSTPRRATQV